MCMTTFEGYSSSSLHERIFIAAMLNPSLKNRSMQEFNMFSRILASFVGKQISPLENKKCSKTKNVKNALF